MSSLITSPKLQPAGISPPSSPRSQGRSFSLLKGRLAKLANTISFPLLILAILSVTGTYIAITQSSEPLAQDSHSVQFLTVMNLLLVIGLILLISFRLLRLWRALRHGLIGSRLQTKIITVFTIVTILPTIVVSIFTAILLNYGIKAWFDERVSTALEQAVAVAESYVGEHKDTIRTDAMSLSAIIRRELPLAIINPRVFNKVINDLASVYSLNEVIVLQNDRVIGRSNLSFSLMFEQLPSELLERANRGGVVVIEEDDKITAIAQMDEVTNTYLIMNRYVNSEVINYMEETQGAVSEYRELKSKIGDLQIQFSVAFVIVSLLILLIIVWYGIIFASRIVVPLSRLMRATERVRAGDFSIHVEPGRGDDEIGLLIQRFNRMTEQLQAQRRDLTLATRTIDARRRFSEAVLEGASAGVLALDPDFKVSLYNRSAMQLLDVSDDHDIKGLPADDIFPDLAPLLKAAAQKPEDLHQADMHFTNQDGKNLTLHVRVSTQHQEDKVEGYIVTFDDISLLVAAQRRAAWSDVARRIAHEIKNPLTPIQLSTERLRKKYTPEDDEEKASFLRYLEMINKHVRDIGNMVEEFVSFARMPQPKFERQNILEIARHASFSSQTAFPETHMQLQLPPEAMEVVCDEQQISQILTNLLKNANESIERRREKDATYKGVIQLSVLEEDGMCHLVIEDNGVGFPPDKIDQMMEPYVTTRAKGTGLGLAIVKKIIEDHDGHIYLANGAAEGAVVTLTLPLVHY